MSYLQDRYINPLTDFGFKKLFGSEPNKALLIDFLNQVLPPHHQIQSLTYASNEQLGNNELDRKAIFDLYCIGQTGERFIVEVQKAKQNYFKDRSVFYSSFPIQDQSKKGNWDFRLDPVYTIGILDFIFDDHKEESDLLHTVSLKNQRCEIFYDKLRFIYIELPKFTKTEEELETHFDKWLFVFRHLSRLQDRPRALQEKVFKQLFEAAEIAKFSREERDAYENSLKYYRDIKKVVNNSREEGREEGLQTGRIEGEREGRSAERLKIAKEMKASGESVEKIMQYTNLTKEEIDEI